jgi:hypothetical protein
MTKKKIYQRPAIELCEAETEEQLLALSSVASTCLDKEESLDYGDTSGNKEKNIWDEAW